MVEDLFFSGVVGARVPHLLINNTAAFPGGEKQTEVFPPPQHFLKSKTRFPHSQRPGEGRGKGKRKARFQFPDFAGPLEGARAHDSECPVLATEATI